MKAESDDLRLNCVGKQLLPTFHLVCIYLCTSNYCYCTYGRYLIFKLNEVILQRVSYFKRLFSPFLGNDSYVLYMSILMYEQAIMNYFGASDFSLV